MNILVVLPIIIPFTTGIILILLWNHRTAQRAVSVAGSGALFITSIILLMTVWRDGILVMQMSNWMAPFGITLIADLLSAIMIVLAGLMSISVAIYSLASMDSGARRLAIIRSFTS